MDTFLSFLFSIVVSFIWYNIGYQKGWSKRSKVETNLFEKELRDKLKLMNELEEKRAIKEFCRNAPRTVTFTSGYVTGHQVEKPSGPITYTLRKGG